MIKKCLQTLCAKLEGPKVVSEISFWFVNNKNCNKMYWWFFKMKQNQKKSKVKMKKGFFEICGFVSDENGNKMYR
jgi:hypothetical protein